MLSLHIINVIFNYSPSKNPLFFHLIYPKKRNMVLQTAKRMSI